MSELTSIIGQQFAFASGRIGVLQQLLLTASDRDRLLGADGIRETEQILTELKITNPIDQGLKKADDILPACSRWMRQEVERMSPLHRRPVFHILWLEDDAPRLSFLLKKHHGFSSPHASIAEESFGAYDAEALTALVEENTVSTTLPEHVVTFIQEMKAMKPSRPQEIDRRVSHFVTSLQKRLARTSGSTLIADFVTHRIDLTNIRTALRLKDEEASLNVFLEGGSLDVKGLKGDAASIASTIEKSYLFSIADSLRKSADDQNQLERELAHVTARDIATLWNVPLSIEPVFAFAALTFSQLKLLRALCIGKRAGLSPQDIKSMLPPFLSASHYVLS